MATLPTILFCGSSLFVLSMSACGARSSLELGATLEGGSGRVEANGGAAHPVGGSPSAGIGGSSGGTSGSGVGGTSGRSCQFGEFSPNGLEPCTRWRDCPLGSYVSRQGTTTGDRECTRCPSNQTTTTLNSPRCEPISIVDLGAGLNTSCAVLSNGTISCWGDNEASLLGHMNQVNIGDDELPSSVSPVTVGASGIGVSKIALGGFNACALFFDGSVKCWGSGFYGETGQGDKKDLGGDEPLASIPPISVTQAPGVTATQIAENNHVCALLSNGSVQCWGQNYSGELGQGNVRSVGDDELPSSVKPVSLSQVAGVTATQIGVGFYHTCALLSDKSVKCWGDNTYGQLGYGNTQNIGDNELPSSVGPVSVSTIPGVTVSAIAVGGFLSCALLSNGSAKCWGYNLEGRLGYGNAANIGDDELPSSVGPISFSTTPGVTVRSITTGGLHSCVILSNDSVKCWGSNLFGELGYGHTRDIGDDELPSSVGAVSITSIPGVTVKKLGLGRVHSCALLSDGSVKCWGQGFYGALGYGNTEDIGDDELPSSRGPVMIF